MADLKLEPAYSMRALAKLLNCGWDNKKLARVLKKGGVVPRPDGFVWISDLKREMRHFLDSLDELVHRRDLSAIKNKMRRNFREEE